MGYSTTGNMVLIWYHKSKIVTDRQMTLTADCGAFANWSGTVSNNGLMVKILSEHIQHDITLLQLQEKYGLEMY